MDLAVGVEVVVGRDGDVDTVLPDADNLGAENGGIIDARDRGVIRGAVGKLDGHFGGPVQADGEYQIAAFVNFGVGDAQHRLDDGAFALGIGNRGVARRDAAQVDEEILAAFDAVIVVGRDFDFGGGFVCQDRRRAA